MSISRKLEVYLVISIKTSVDVKPRKLFIPDWIDEYCCNVVITGNFFDII